MTRTFTENDYKLAQEARVLILTPSPGKVEATFAFDLCYLTRESGATFSLAQGAQLPIIRDALLKSACSTTATHALFIDSDMRFPSNTVMQLVSRGKDMIGANCRIRSTVEEVWTARSGGGDYISSVGRSGVQEVGSLGFGVTLIDLTVARKLEDPMFAMPWDGERYVGEDAFFCHQFTQAGFKIWIDHDLSQEVRHTATIEKGVLDAQSN